MTLCSRPAHMQLTSISPRHCFFPRLALRRVGGKHGGKPILIHALTEYWELRSP